VSEATTGICCDCGALFSREAHEQWKRRCLRCWIASKTTTKRAPVDDPLRAELAANLPALLQLVHPDKHGNSPAANRVTVWLLDVRRRLPRMEHAA